MILQSQKGLKPLLIRYLAFVIGFCYLANPFHQQIRTVFHEISHLIESPETVLSHNTSFDHGEHLTEHSHDHHSFGVDLEDFATTDHQHTLLDLIDSLLDGSDQQHPGEDYFSFLLKWDKHITSTKSTFVPIGPEHHTADFTIRERHVNRGYLSVPHEPPQHFLSFL